MKTISKTIIAASVATLMSASAFAAEFNFKFQSSDPSGEKNFQVQQAWAEQLEKDTDGRIDVTMLPVGAVIKHTETLDGIKFGVLQGHITATGFFAGKDPAFGLMGNTVGAWSEPEQLLDYMYNGGGNELMREIYKPYGIYYIGASATGLEAFVSKVPLNGVADLKGLKLRAPEGLVQQVFAAAGASPVNLPGSEVFTGLSKGVIDAADYTVFSTNHKAGLNDVAPHPVYPGFHSLPAIEVSISAKSWNKLPADLQKIMQDSVKTFAYTMVDTLKKADAEAVAEAIADPKITVHDWPAAERKKFRTIARSQWEVYAKRSPNAQKVYDSVTAHLKAKNLL